jgi:cyclophilin family peptidyl-prolyl cis-trans isomerase
MDMRWHFGLALLVALAACVPLRAADDEPAPANEPAAAEQAPAEGDAPADEAAPTGDGDFAALFAQWNELRDRMNQLREQFGTAKQNEKPAIEEEFNGLVEKGHALAPQVQAAAEGAFAADSTNEDARDFLAGAAVGEFRNDNFEEAIRLLDLLIAGGFEDKHIYELAGLAASNISDLDKAEDYLNTAKKEKVISPEGSRALAGLPQAREQLDRELALREAEAQADDLPRVLMKTNKGDITIELFENEAPNTVANFISLVEKKYYDGLTFHRVLPGFMAQGGCPDGTGGGGPGYNIPCECDSENHRTHFRGSLSMAHAGKDTGGSQFFLTFIPTTHLDGKHTVFGRVIDGMDVLGKLQRRDPEDPRGPEPDTIEEATVIRKRDHEYVPMKTPE